MVEEYHFDAVIADNRFGLYHSTVPFFITHQLTIKSPLGNGRKDCCKKEIIGLSTGLPNAGYRMKKEKIISQVNYLILKTKPIIPLSISAPFKI